MRSQNNLKKTDEAYLKVKYSFQMKKVIFCLTSMNISIAELRIMWDKGTF